MYISKLYKYEKDGIVGVGLLPEGAEILETMDILNAEEGYTLIRKPDFEDMGSSVWLRNGDTQENYGEKKVEDDEVA